MNADCLAVLTEHIRRYPQMQLEDAVKLLYQRAFGGGHLVEAGRALERIEMEWEAPAPADTPAYEPLGDRVGRLYLPPARAMGIAPETAAGMFLLSAEEIDGRMADFEAELAVLQTACRQGALPFDAAALACYLDGYRRAGYPPVSHSARYHAAYHPHYRVIAAAYREGLPLIARIDRMLAAGETVRLAIDGASAAGKSTLASRLASLYRAPLIHMDDFFLPPERKTAERLAEPGGNVDYERFVAEVVEPLDRGEPFAYRPYRCQTHDFGPPVPITPGRLVIVEGAYCLHPLYAGRWNLRVFYGIDPAVQRQRILARNGERMLARFLTEWIPLEQRYDAACHIHECCDLLLWTGA